MNRHCAILRAYRYSATEQPYTSLPIQSLPFGWRRYPTRQAHWVPAALVWQWCAHPKWSRHHVPAKQATNLSGHSVNILSIEFYLYSYNRFQSDLRLAEWRRFLFLPIGNKKSVNLRHYYTNFNCMNYWNNGHNRLITSKTVEHTIRSRWPLYYIRQHVRHYYH